MVKNSSHLRSKCLPIRGDPFEQMDACDRTSFSILFQSYQDDGRVITKG